MIFGMRSATERIMLTTATKVKTCLGPDGVLDRSSRVHGRELSSDARKAERVSSKHEVRRKRAAV